MVKCTIANRLGSVSTYPTINIELWTEDAVVLFHWLQSVDLDRVPAEHKAVKQALTDLHSRLEEIVPYKFELSPQRISAAQHEVSKDMGL